MKKRIVLLLLSILTILLMTLSCSKSGAVGIPEGYTSCEEYFDKIGFQDYSDYCKYYYPSDEAVKTTEGFRPVLGRDIDDIKGYFEDFAEWMEMDERSEEFDFDSSCMNEGDFYRILSAEGESVEDLKFGKYDDYTVYYFDTETLTLYYIHTSI